MTTIWETGVSLGSTVLAAGIDYAARSPLTHSSMSGSHLEGLMAAGLVLVFMVVALLRPEWMG
ncbi:MAG: hypothetical protein FD138_265 [Planctomycetota bacterium]|nr:MAG: hypothetical protein FD138_265 [Planctomycetota bacterium]